MTAVTALLECDLAHWYSQAADALMSLQQAWIFLTALASSGIIGFGTAAWLYHLVKDATPTKPKVLKPGTARFKQVVRRNKFKQRRVRKKFHKLLSFVPSCPDRNDLMYHPRFNNLGRQDCYEPPKI